MIHVAKVPCGSCTACCRWELIFLMDGDDPSMYLTMPWVNPLTGQEGFALQHRENGECVYLGEKGCTIHDHAPVVCKEFDCRMWYLSRPRAERRRMMKDSQSGVAGEVLRAGMLRQPTLTMAEKNDAHAIRSQIAGRS